MSVDLPLPAVESLPSLTFERTAPRDLVHRRAIGEVLLTDDWLRLGADRFRALDRVKGPSSRFQGVDVI